MMHWFAIDDALETMAIEGIEHFSPHYVCTRSGVADVRLVTEYMFELVDRKLRVTYEVECPNGDSDFAIYDLSVLETTPRNCQICGIEYSPSPEHIWVVFNFLKEYTQHLKKNKSLRSR